MQGVWLWKDAIQTHDGFRKELNVLSNRPWCALFWCYLKVLSQSVIATLTVGLTPQWLSTLKTFWPSLSGYQARHQSYISITQACLTVKTSRWWPTDQFNPTVSKHNPNVWTTFVVMWQELINFCNYLETTKKINTKPKHLPIF